MSYKESFPPINIDEDLTTLPILKVKDIKNLQHGENRIGLTLIIEAVSFMQAYPDYDSGQRKYLLKCKDFVFQVDSDNNFYYMKNLYDFIFPWFSTKDKYISFSVCANNSCIGNVTRIFNIDSILANIN